MNIKRAIQARNLMKANSIGRGFSLEKARSGIYADTPENKKLNRVGQKYGTSGREEEKSSPRTKKEEPTSKPKGDAKPEESESKSATSEPTPQISKHEVAQLTHMKSVAESDPVKAAEIYTALSPEAQSIVPQEVVNKIVSESHASPEEGEGPSYEDLGKSEKKEETKEDFSSVDGKPIGLDSMINTPWGELRVFETIGEGSSRAVKAVDEKTQEEHIINVKELSGSVDKSIKDDTEVKEGNTGKLLDILKPHESMIITSDDNRLALILGNDENEDASDLALSLYESLEGHDGVEFNFGRGEDIPESIAFTSEFDGFDDLDEDIVAIISELTSEESEDLDKKESGEKSSEKTKHTPSNILTDDTEVKEGDTAVVKEDIFYVEEHGGLMTESEAEDEGYDISEESPYMDAGDKVTATEGGTGYDVMWEGEGSETSLDSSWLKDFSSKEEI